MGRKWEGRGDNPKYCIHKQISVMNSFNPSIICQRSKSMILNQGIYQSVLRDPNSIHLGSKPEVLIELVWSGGCWIELVMGLIPMRKHR